MLAATATSAEEWQELSSRHFVPVRVDEVRPDFHASIASRVLGSGVRVTSVEAAPCRLTRTTKMVAAESPESAYLLTLERSGPFGIGQAGREARISAGEAVLYSVDAPFQLVCEQRTGCVTVGVPASAIGLRRSAVTPVLMRRLDRRIPALHVMSAFAAAVATIEGPPDAQTEMALGQTAADLLRTVVIAVTNDPDAVPDGMDGLVFSMRRHIHDHLRDPNLTVAEVAAAHRVSNRYVSSLFAQAGLPAPAAYIRDERLKRAASLLITDLPVAQVGYQSGFTDPTTFTRAFRRRFGCSPGEWRRGAPPAAAS